MRIEQPETRGVATANGKTDEEDQIAKNRFHPEVQIHTTEFGDMSGDLLFDTPWWLPVLIVAIGAFVFVSGNRREQAGTRNAGAGIIFLAVIIVVLTLFVDTPRKIARRESRQIVQSAVDGDWTTFQSLLEPDAGLRMLSAPTLYADAKQLTAAAKAGTQRVHLKEAHVRSMEVTESGGLVTTTLALLTEQEEAAAPMLQSTWQFEFQQTGGLWRIHEIRALQIGEMGGDEAEQFMPKVPK